MVDDVGQSTRETGEHSHPSSNRYILFAALAFAAVVTIYIVKTNLEPPKPEDVAATQDINSRIPDDMPGAGPIDSIAQRQEMMHQIEHIKDVLKRDSTNADAWASLGNMYFDANMPNEAIFHYQRALSLKPDDLHVMTDLATMLRAAGRFDTAVVVLEQVVATDSTLTQAWFNLGVIQSFDLKNHKEALIAWKKFLALTPPSEHTEPVLKEIERLEKELGT